MKKIFTLIAIISSLFLCSCSTQRIAVGSKSREVPKTNPHYSYWDNFLFWGVGQTKFNNAQELCKNNNGVDFVETRLSFAQGLLTGLTYGIYSPRTINIYCKDN